MTQADPDPDTFTALMHWLRARGKSSLALPLRRKGIGSLTALLAADAQQLKDADCPQDLIETLLGAARPSAAPAEPPAAPAAQPADPPPTRPRPSVKSAARAAAAKQAAAPAPARNDEEVSDLFAGARVTLRDLKANADLNGKVGTVVGFEESKGRWVVDMGEELGRKLFREANLSVPGVRAVAPEEAPSALSPAAPLEAAAPPPPPTAQLPEAPPGPPVASTGRPLRPGAQVLVEGPGEASLDRAGQVGICEMCDFGTGLWRVRFACGDEEALPPSCLSERRPTLRPGAYVRLVGLQSAGNLNGRLGICSEFDETMQRWSVCLESSEWKSLKAENLQPHDGSARQHESSNGLDFSHEDRKFLSAMEDALSSGEISWLDC